MTKVELELLQREDQYLFIERAIRGGVSTITKRWATANHPGVPNYNPNQELSHLLYIDSNNLYGWSMSQFLPTHGFRWLTQEEITKLVISNISDEATTGYFFEVDLKYPDSLHVAHNDYPLAAEHLSIEGEILSPFQQQTYPKSKLQPCTKLAPNLFDKKKYILHYRNLKFYLEQGMILEKVHRVLEFQQSPWLKNYIDFNTERRTESTSAFGKDFFKLMNNAVFGTYPNYCI